MPLGISPELLVRYAVNTIPPSLVTLIPLAGDRSDTERIITQVEAKKPFEIIAKVK